MILDALGRVRSQIKSVVCQIQRFDFDCNLGVTGKVIIRSAAVLRLRGGLSEKVTFIQGFNIKTMQWHYKV